MKDLNGLLLSQRQVNLKDVCWCIMLDSFIGHVCGVLSLLIVSIRL